MAEIDSIQNIPQGLLDLLGMKGSGINPRTLDSSVKGTCDLRQAYALTRVSSPIATAAAAVPENIARLTVPANEHWILLGAVTTITVSGGVTTFLSGTVSVAYSSASIVTHVAERSWNRGDGLAFAAGSFFRVPFLAPYPLILRPGATIEGAYLHAQSTSAQASVSLVANVGVLT